MGTRSYLFVYGTLRKGHGTRMSKWLARHAQFFALGSYRGKLVDLGRYPGAIPSREPSDKVVGDLYLLPDGTGILRVLDGHEGRKFCRRKTTIRLKNKKNVAAWIYLFRGPTAGRQIIRSGNYLRFLKPAAAPRKKKNSGFRISRKFSPVHGTNLPDSSPLRR